MPQDFRDAFSSKKCTKCGAPAAGFKCSACGYTSEHFDTNHWRDCNKGGKMAVRCSSCGQAENECTCAPVSNQPQ